MELATPLTPMAFQSLVRESFAYLEAEGYQHVPSSSSPWEVVYQHLYCTVCITFQEPRGDYNMTVQSRFFPPLEKLSPVSLYQYFKRPPVEIARTMGAKPSKPAAVAEAIPHFAKTYAEISRQVTNFFEPTRYESNVASFLAYRHERSLEVERQLQLWEAARQSNPA